MQQFQRQFGRILTVTAFCLILGLLAGCTGVGPRNISKGRADYNEAINTTEDEQMLLAIVKGRYGESNTLLAVSSITANVSFTSSASINAGFGPEENYSGNLVPFSGGLVYEENPTISYTPINSEKYIRQIMTPIPADIFLLTLSTVGYVDRDHIIMLLIKRINNLQNPDFIQHQSVAGARQFNDFVTLWTELRNVGVIELLMDTSKLYTFDIVINSDRKAYEEKVKRFLSLLEIKAPETGVKEMVVPLSFGRQPKDFKGITISTRSTMEIIEILRGAVEIPLEHEQAHLTVMYPPLGNPGEGVRILSSRDKPGGLSTAVKYRDYWFYIDEADQLTKQSFRLLRFFWSLDISGSIDDDSIPIPTIPVR